MASRCADRCPDRRCLFWRGVTTLAARLRRGSARRACAHDRGGTAGAVRLRPARVMSRRRGPSLPKWGALPPSRSATPPELYLPR